MVLVAFVGTFSVSKLVDIVEDSIGADDARVGGVCRVHAKDIFLNLHENSAKSPMWMDHLYEDSCTGLCS